MSFHTTRNHEYRYSELLDGTSPKYKQATVRVLCIQPRGTVHGNQTDLVCTTELLDLHEADAVGFEALSYTWGNEEATCAIKLDGKSFLIRPYLSVILHHLQHEAEVRRMWIDAICINQDDDSEKSHQVQMMRRIYQRASRTIIWLGVESDESSVALRLLRVLGEKMLQIYEEHGLSMQEMFEMQPKEESHGTIARVRLLENQVDAAFKKLDYDEGKWLRFLNPLLRRPWFSRAWIRQEAAVATNAIVHCGPATLDWKMFANGVHLLNHRGVFGGMKKSWDPANDIKGENRKFFDDLRENVSPLVVFCDLYQSSGGRGLDYRRILRHLTVTNYPDCTDSRDRVFALVGLANNLSPNAPELWNIMPDYRLTPQEVYARATRAIIDLSWDTPEDCLRILTFSCRTKWRMADLPSWVPNWNEPFRPNIAGSFGEPQTFTADLNIGPKQVGWTREMMFPDSQTLKLVGFRFGEVFEVGKTFEELTGGDVMTAVSIMAWIRGCMSLWSYQAGECRTGAEMHELHLSHLHSDFSPYERNDRRIARTLIMDMSVTTLTVEETYGKQFAKAWENDRAEDLEVRMFDVFRGALPVPESFLPNADITSNEGKWLFISEYLSLAFEAASGRRAVMLDNGYIGLVPSYTRPGDILAVFYGAPIPFVLRDHGDYCELIGGCYIHGAMDGEIVSRGQHTLREFLVR